jgi:hypothetical protein
VRSTGQVFEVRAALMATSAGSSEIEVKELTAIPTARSSMCAARATTPVGYTEKARRRARSRGRASVTAVVISASFH